MLHTEVDIVLANDGPVDFGYLVQDGDSVSVYPASTSQYIPSAVPLRPQLQEFRFVLDTHLGRLAVPQDVGLRCPVSDPL